MRIIRERFLLSYSIIELCADVAGTISWVKWIRLKSVYDNLRAIESGMKTLRTTIVKKQGVTAVKATEFGKCEQAIVALEQQIKDPNIAHLLNQ